MPDPKFSKPWHGIPRDTIKWNPTILEDACIGCGTCVTGCSRMVYRYDFDRKKPMVVDPLNCMVGCTTCANTCPTHAITFPPIETVLALETKSTVRHSIEDDLIARKDILKTTSIVPHPDRIITLAVSKIDGPTKDILLVTLTPINHDECFCEFVPGQYIEVWRPQLNFLSRGYSVAKKNDGSGAIDLHIRRVEGGRFTSWAFDEMKIGDQLQARGPLGNFTMRSLLETPLLFIAGGSGLAPILAILNQQIEFTPNREARLIWGMKDVGDFYALEALKMAISKATNLKVFLAAETGDWISNNEPGFVFTKGNVVDVIIANQKLMDGHDFYAAGPPAMLRDVVHTLESYGVDSKRIHVDSFGG